MARKSYLLNDNWIFKKEKEQWAVNLPHTWNNIDGQDGGNDYYRGTCVYEKKFDFTDFDPKKEEIYLEFEGVSATATVFLNDKLLGVHKGGYSTFRFEVTDCLKDKDNALVVHADNSKNDEVYPQMADFTFYGGIYRDVHLIVVNKLHFEMLAFGTPGIKVTPYFEGDKEKVFVESFLGEMAGNTSLDIRYTVFDTDGNKVAQECIEYSRQGKVPLKDEQNGTEVVLSVNEPHLWQGVKDPYLYSLKAELISQDEVVDEINTHFGIRSFIVDPEKGFFLNGERYPLHGVSRHQDYKGLGSAITKAHHEADMALIRELGANTIRLAHYQHDQYFYDLCDKYGMIVWAEIPYISAHLSNGNENTESQMRELIAQNYNHPSIVTWGISNEITISHKNHKDMLKNHEYMNNLVHKLDPTRPTTLACFAMCNPFSKVAHITDIVGFNLYLGWYVPGLWLNDLYIKGFHLFYPKQPFGYSEYGAEGMPNLHSEHPRRGDHTEEYQAKYHEYMLRCFKKYPFMWANHVWNMFDFAADARNQGGEPGMNHKGLVTFDRQTKKDSFYLYKCYWNDEPMVHICSKRFEERRNRKIKIKVYSNCDKVVLTKNGEILATKTGNKVFEFAIELEPGKNNFKAQAYTKDGKILTDEAVFVLDENARKYSLSENKAKSGNWM